MNWIKDVIDFIFSIALFINALLFVPQAIKIIKEKSAKDVSLMTFGGLVLIQLSIILYAISNKDWLMAWGYLLSIATTGTVVVLAWFYRRKEKLSGASAKSAPGSEQNNLELLENIIAVMPGHVYWLDREGVYLGCNDQQAESIGLPSRKDIVGKRNKDIPGFLIPEVLDKYNGQVMSSAQGVTVEEPALLKDGTQATFLSRKEPLFDRAGNVVGMVGISIDLTEKKEAEVKLAKAHDQLSFITSALGNVVRTPIHTITMALDMLRDAGLTQKAEGLVQTIESSISHLLPTLSYAADYAALEAGSLHLYMSKLSMVDILELVISGLYSTSSLCCYINYHSQEECFVQFDGEKISQVLHLLLAFSSQVGDASKLIDYRVSGEQVQLEFSCDTDFLTEQIVGSVASEEIDDSAPTTKNILQLIYCQRLIKEMGGDLKFLSRGDKYHIEISFIVHDKVALSRDKESDSVYVLDDDQQRAAAICSSSRDQLRWVSSSELETISPEKGSIVLVPDMKVLHSNAEYLRSCQKAGVKVQALLGSGNLVPNVLDTVAGLSRPYALGDFLRVEDEGRAAPEKHILYVEDENICRRLTTYTLTNLGYGVMAVPSAEEALKLDLSKFDAVILDMGLPGMDGFELAENIREQFDSSQLKLVALTGHTLSVGQDEIDVSNMFEAYMKKPARLAELEKILADLWKP